MALPVRDLLTLLVPPSIYYSRRLAEEAIHGEPELDLLPELVRRDGLAVDVGVNQGFYAYALARLAGRVLGFEPNPDYAFFARWMLRGARVDVLRYALSNHEGRATFHVPISDEGMVLHFGGSLDGNFKDFSNIRKFDVAVRTLDSFGLTDVCFLKVDVEGTERDVLDGGRETILRERPVMILELLTGSHADPHGVTAAICADFGYDAYLVKDGTRLPALPAITALGTNTTWGSEYKTRNVLFLPR